MKTIIVILLAMMSVMIGNLKIQNLRLLVVLVFVLQWSLGDCYSDLAKGYI